MTEIEQKKDKLNDLTKEAIQKELLLCISCHEKLTLLSEEFNKKSAMRKLGSMAKYIRDIQNCLCDNCRRIF